MAKTRTRKFRGGAFAGITPNATYNIQDDERTTCDATPKDLKEDKSMRCKAHEMGKTMLEKWLTDHETDIKQIMEKFDDDGKLTDGVSATAFNDLYKWTMLPVIRKLETYKSGPITVTFGIDLRDSTMRKEMREDSKLCEVIHDALKTLESRKFDREMFESILQGPRAGILTSEDIDAVCGPMGSEKSLVDSVQPYNIKYDHTANNVKTEKVTVSFYYLKDLVYNGETGVHFIEATGPWHRVTWLETTLMQCVYEAKLRYDLAKKEKTYNKWIYGALLRCAKSVAYTKLVQANQPINGKPILPALFTGRRTGGFLFLVLQNLFFAHHFEQFVLPPKEYKPTDILTEKSQCLGTSSCDAWYFLKKLGLPCLNPVGTHAHELSMVTSVLFPQLDQNEQHLPLTQVVGHYLYRELTWRITKGPMPMLPDTLGTPAFLRAATYLTEEDGTPFLKSIGSARQDSGALEDFKENMKDFGYTGGMMASEIDDTITLLKAAEIGYGTFGAGGFFGDSEKVWGDKAVSSNSMAVKAVRVKYNNAGGGSVADIPYMKDLGDGNVEGYPVKIGDPADRTKPKLAEGKLSLDKSLPLETLKAIKKYAEDVRVTAWEEPQKAKAEGKPFVNGSKTISEILSSVTASASGSAANAASASDGGARKSRKMRRAKRNFRKPLQTRRHR